MPNQLLLFISLVADKFSTSQEEQLTVDLE